MPAGRQALTAALCVVLAACAAGSQTRTTGVMTTRKPCTGPKALTKVERWHGPEVIQLALWDGSPRSWKYDPATAALRLGFRQNRFQSHKPFNDQLPADVNLGLLKAAYRGQAHLIPAFLEEGADINFVAKAKTGAAAELVGLSPLSAAAHQGHIDSVHLLLAKGADVQCGSVKDPSGSGVLWLEVCRQQAAKNDKTHKDWLAKVRPIVGANRRTPGNRKTRHAKGARGANR